MSHANEWSQSSWAPHTFISTMCGGWGEQVPTCREHAPVPESHILIISANSHLIGVGLQVGGHHLQLTRSKLLCSIQGCHYIDDHQ